MVDGIQTVTNLALLIGPVPNHAERWRWGCMDAIVSGDLAYPWFPTIQLHRRGRHTLLPGTRIASVRLISRDLPSIEGVAAKPPAVEKQERLHVSRREKGEQLMYRRSTKRIRSVKVLAKPNILTADRWLPKSVCRELIKAADFKYGEWRENVGLWWPNWKEHDPVWAALMDVGKVISKHVGRDVAIDNPHLVHWKPDIAAGCRSTPTSKRRLSRTAIGLTLISLSDLPEGEGATHFPNRGGLGIEPRAGRKLSCPCGTEPHGVEADWRRPLHADMLVVREPTARSRTMKRLLLPLAIVLAGCTDPMAMLTDAEINRIGTIPVTVTPPILQYKPYPIRVEWHECDYDPHPVECDNVSWRLDPEALDTALVAGVMDAVAEWAAVLSPTPAEEYVVPRHNGWLWNCHGMEAYEPGDNARGRIHPPCAHADRGQGVWRHREHLRPPCVEHRRESEAAERCHRFRQSVRRARHQGLGRPQGEVQRDRPARTRPCLHVVQPLVRYPEMERGPLRGMARGPGGRGRVQPDGRGELPGPQGAGNHEPALGVRRAGRHHGTGKTDHGSNPVRALEGARGDPAGRQRLRKRLAEEMPPSGRRHELALEEASIRMKAAMLRAVPKSESVEVGEVAGVDVGEIEAQIERAIRDQIENREFYPVIPAIVELRATWDDALWVKRMEGSDPDADLPIDVFDPRGNYIGTLPAGGLGMPRAFGPSGLVAYWELDELDIPSIVVRHLPDDLRW